MTKQALRVSAIDLWADSIWVAVALIWVFISLDWDPFTQIFWGTMLVMACLRFGMRLWRPLLAYEDGCLLFVPLGSFLERARLRIDEIVAVRESSRKGIGSFAMTELPSFVFVFAGGRTIEFFPRLKAGERLLEIRRFLASIPELPAIETATAADPFEVDRPA